MKTTLIDNPKQLLLDMAKERHLSKLLQLLVDRITSSPRVALVRIWLVRPGDICESCPMKLECRNRTRCLHLVASAGKSKNAPKVEWNRLNGEFCRFPLGIRKVGRIWESGTPIEVPDLATFSSDWVAKPEWISDEGISGFGGQPLIHRDEVLGVLAVFARGTIGSECMDWLRTIADHTAAAIVTARAFEEIEDLKKRLELENEYLREEVTQSGVFGELIGQSPAIEAVSRQIDLVAATDASVLILGESGTGKELVARELHQRSKRAAKPIIKVNCAAIPRELYESEFFGHLKGSFTGAIRDRVGRFELADGGTLFLDEVGEIPLELQSKLLRVLQEGELERVGEERTRRVNVRIIAATNRDLKKEAEAGRFRKDLYYRLSVFPVELPPLRNRSEDIPLLADHFLNLLCRKLGRQKPRLTLANVQILQRYDWPGNIRELQHVIERTLITSLNSRLSIQLPETPRSDSPQPSTAIEKCQPGRVMTEHEIRELEKENIRLALKKSHGKVHGPTGAAELLGMKATTLASRIKSMGIVE